jgi:hypothetical protein
MTPFKSTAVAKVLDSYPAPMRRRLLSLRELIVGHRALVFDNAEPVPTDALGVCIAMALTYHAKRQQR